MAAEPVPQAPPLSEAASSAIGGGFIQTRRPGLLGRLRLPGQAADRLTSSLAHLFALGAGAMLVAFAVVAGLSRMIADDYKYFARLDQTSLFGYVVEHLQIENGRYSMALLVAAGYKLFGEACIPIVIIAAVGLVLVGCWVAARLLLPFRPGFNTIGPIAVGLAGTVLAIYTAKSMADSYLWLTSMTVYVPPIGLLCLSIALSCRIARRLAGGETVKWPALVGTGLLIVASQGFNEPTGVLTIGFFAVMLIYLLGRRQWRAAVYTGGALFLAVAGWVALMLAPAQTARVAAFETTDRLGRALAGIPKGLETVQRFTSQGDVVLCISVGLLLIPLLNWGAGKLWRWLAGIGVTLIVVPFLVTVLGVHFAAGYETYRTYTVVTAAVAWGVGLVVAAAGGAVWRFIGAVAAGAGRRIAGAPAVSPIVASLALVALFAGALTHARPVLDLARAEGIRAQAVAMRDAVIRQAVAAGTDPIPVIPAPLLTAPAGGTDFSYGEQAPPAWYLGGFRDYFDVPPDVELVVDRVQPLGYCIGGWTGHWIGAATCGRQLEAIINGEIKVP